MAQPDHDPRTGRFRPHNESGLASRFKPGHAVGRSTRFAPGRSGNPNGRPPKVDTCVKRFRAAGLTRDELHELFEGKCSRKPERIAAFKLLIDRYRRRPFPDANQNEAWCRYFELRHLDPIPLTFILLNRTKTPTEREAARLALEKPY